jgi:hypothetical protein
VATRRAPSNIAEEDHVQSSQVRHNDTMQAREPLKKFKNSLKTDGNMSWTWTV